MKKYIKHIVGLLAVALVIVGCGTETETSGGAEGNGTIEIVATTTMITDLVEVIGGEQVNVHGLMGPGIDPHGYQATPSDISNMQKADIVAYNGMDLEGQMGEIFAELENFDTSVFVLEHMMYEDEMLDSEEEGMTNDPHIWFNVPLWAEASNYITESLSDYDPDNAEYYESNNETYQEKLEELDAYIWERVEEVPENSRYLVTAHDAFGYFGDEYDFEVVAIQGLNTQTEAGTGDISQLADFIAEQEITAIFVETSVPTQTIEALKDAVENRDWQVEIGGELYSDALGDEQSGTDTYITMYEYNIDTIVDALVTGN